MYSTYFCKEGGWAVNLFLGLKANGGSAALVAGIPAALGKKEGIEAVFVQESVKLLNARLAEVTAHS